MGLLREVRSAQFPYSDSAFSLTHTNILTFHWQNAFLQKNIQTSPRPPSDISRPDMIPQFRSMVNCQQKVFLGESCKTISTPNSQDVLLEAGLSEIET